VYMCVYVYVYMCVYVYVCVYMYMCVCACACVCMYIYFLPGREQYKYFTVYPVTQYTASIIWTNWDWGSSVNQIVLIIKHACTLLTYCMKHSPWEANWFSASQEIPHILCTAWSTVLEKLTGSQLVKKFPTFYVLHEAQSLRS